MNKKNNKHLVTIRGERNSGTNWARQLVLKNADVQWMESKNHDYEDGRYGWKHAFLSDDNIKKINEENAILIVIYRDIFSWLISTYKRSYCKGFSAKEMSFSKFIRHKYNFHNEKANNIIELRTNKIKQWNASKVNNKYIVNYEYMNVCLKNIPIFNKKKWQPIKNYVRHGNIYDRKHTKTSIDDIIKYYNREDVKFIFETMNLKLERSINYSYVYLKKYFKL